MAYRDTSDEKPLKGMLFLGMTASATTITWATFKRDFLNRTVYLADAHTYLDTGVLPTHPIPDYNELITEDEGTLSLGARVTTTTVTRTLLSTETAEPSTEPPPATRRYPIGRIGETLWKEHYIEANSLRKK